MDTTSTPRIEELAEFTVIGMEQLCQMGVDNKLPALWDKLFERWEEIPGFVDFYGVCLSREDSKPGFRYLAAVKVAGKPQAPAGMVAATVPPAKYAVYPFNDKVSEFPAKFAEIYGTLLPAAGLTPDSSYQCLEFYPHDCYDEATGKIRADIYVSII